MAKHPHHHDDGTNHQEAPAPANPPADPHIKTVVEHLNALITAMQHSSQNNAPISMQMINEVMKIRDALEGTGALE